MLLPVIVGGALGGPVGAALGAALAFAVEHNEHSKEMIAVRSQQSYQEPNVQDIVDNINVNQIKLPPTSRAWLREQGFKETICEGRTIWILK